MVHYLNTKSKYKEKFRELVGKLIRSMTFEFVPPQFSPGLIQVYLEDRNKIEETTWPLENKKLFRQLYPYQDLFLILHNLSRYLVDAKKPVNLDHYLELLESPMMGVVEWPMVIGGRDMSDLPPIFNVSLEESEA